MKTINKPKTLIRISDGEEFVLNKNGTYSNKLMLPYRKKGHFIMEWSYECLMESNVKYFKIKNT